MGDICLLGWEAKLGKGQYRMCRVVEIEPDQNGLVRSVTVEFRPKDVRQKGLPYISKELVQDRVSVQRLVLLHPASTPIED